MVQNTNFNYIQISLLSLSLIIPLIMLESPIWLIGLVTFIMFSPLLFASLIYAAILYFSYDIIRPILYIWALVVTIQGKQDFFAVAFYILMALQAASIIKRLIGSVSMCILFIVEIRGKRK